MTDEQFLEIVNDAMERHISRDPDVVENDCKWENLNFAATLSEHLRINGFSVPRVSAFSREVDPVRERQYADRLGAALSSVFK